MSVKFNLAKPITYKIGNIEQTLREGTIANGNKYINWAREVSPYQTKETTGVLEKIPNTDYFSDLYSFIVRKAIYLTRDGVEQTRIEKLTNGKGSTVTYMENGIRTMKHSYDPSGDLIKTTLYNDNGLPVKIIQ